MLVLLCEMWRFVSVEQSARLVAWSAVAGRVWNPIRSALAGVELAGTDSASLRRAHACSSARACTQMVAAPVAAQFVADLALQSRRWSRECLLLGEHQL